MSCFQYSIGSKLTFPIRCTEASWRQCSDFALQPPRLAQLVEVVIFLLGVHWFTGVTGGLGFVSCSAQVIPTLFCAQTSGVVPTYIVCPRSCEDTFQRQVVERRHCVKLPLLDTAIALLDGVRLLSPNSFCGVCVCVYVLRL